MRRASHELVVSTPGQGLHEITRDVVGWVAGTGITVNCVLPGPTRSRGLTGIVDAAARRQGKSFEEIEADFFRRARPTSLIRRFATNEEVAAMVVYLASPRASATTGAALRVDGGVVKSAF